MEDTRVIYVERGNGQWQKLTIPATAKVTFGPLLAGGPDRFGSGGLYLRIYKTKDVQLAVINNVLSFRDADISLADPAGDGFAEQTETDLIGISVQNELKPEQKPHRKGGGNGGMFTWVDRDNANGQPL